MTQEKATATNYDGLWGRQIKAEAERRKRMATPTPRPWEWLPKEGNLIVDANRNIVAEVPCSGGNPADGALIVTAVNERDALLSEVAHLREAVKGAIGYLESDHVTPNLFRMGLLGKMEVEKAIKLLRERNPQE
jgi:hypothetical protein